MTHPFLPPSPFQPSPPWMPRGVALDRAWPDRALTGAARATSDGEFTRAFLRRRGAGGFVAASGAGALSAALTAKESRLEAALFVAGAPLSSARLAQFATLADAAEVKRLVGRLNERYDRVRSAFRVERVASGYVLLTRPAFAFWLDRLHQRQAEMKLTPPQMETLTIVAYRQPITRADVEAVRGVQCAEMLKQLMDRGLIRIGGEDESLGRPYLYVTTRSFLELYGIRSLDELPMAESLRKPASSKAISTSEADDEADAPLSAAA